jgi:hypothetical protein
MPSNSYRRKLRTNRSSKPYITPAFLNNCNTKSCDSTQLSELEKIQNYFYDVIDMIIQHDKFTSAVTILNNIISSVREKVEFYKILEVIENQLLSIVVNISDSVPIGIIAMRIECVKEAINTLPADCNEVGPISIMILEIIDLLKNNISFSTVISNINELKTYINDKYGKYDEIIVIQDQLLSIVTNIGNGFGYGIICTRVEYVKDLVSKL